MHEIPFRSPDMGPEPSEKGPEMASKTQTADTGEEFHFETPANDAAAETEAVVEAVAEAEEDEFADLVITVERKPVGGVTAGAIPEKLAKLLAEHAPKALEDKDHELSLTAKDEAQAKKLAGYARAWGAQQTPKLYIHKVPNRRDMKPNVARLAVELDSEVSQANRPGRRGGN